MPNRPAMRPMRVDLGKDEGGLSWVRPMLPMARRTPNS